MHTVHPALTIASLQRHLDTSDKVHFEGINLTIVFTWDPFLETAMLNRAFRQQLADTGAYVFFNTGQHYSHFGRTFANYLDNMKRVLSEVKTPVLKRATWLTNNPWPLFVLDSRRNTYNLYVMDQMAIKLIHEDPDLNIKILPNADFILPVSDASTDVHFPVQSLFYAPIFIARVCGD